MIDYRVLHILKVTPESFKGLGSNIQIRKDDRDFKVEDLLWSYEIIDQEGTPSGYGEASVVTHVVRNFEGLQEGYVVLRTRPSSLIIFDGKKYETKRRRV